MKFKYIGDQPIILPFVEGDDGHPLSVSPGDEHEFHKAPSADWERVTEATHERAPRKAKGDE